MSELQDFIIKNGILDEYRGSSEVVIIPEGVHTIDSLAFLSDTKKTIKHIQFPESLKVIKNWAFDRCKSLENIVIPANVKEIGQGAFNSCKMLKDVIIEGNPTIGDGAFRWTQWEEDEFKKAGAQIKDDVLLRVHPELTEYIIPSNIKIIGRDAFRYCKIKEVVIPHGVTEIGICAFSDSAIERVSLPETLKVVDGYAFSNCTNLTELTIPKSVTRISSCAFEQLPNCVLTILNDCEDEELISFAFHAFARDTACIKEVHAPYGSVAMRYAKKSGLEVTTIPHSPEKIGRPQKYHYINDEFCCEGSTLHEYFGHQEVVYVPDGISVIGRNAFTNTKVKKVFFPKSVFLIEEYGFSGTDLIEITGEGVYTIEQRAFYGCKNLERATFPELASCYDISFEGCKRLSRKDLIIPYEAHIIEVEFQPCGCGHRRIKVTPFTNSQNNDDEQCVACGGNGSGH